jgi:hypothetical protein
MKWLIGELEELRSAVNAGLGDTLTQPQLIVQDAPFAED